MNTGAGFVRFVGSGENGCPLVTDDLRIEVCQADGSWIPLRGVCRAKFDLLPGQITTAELTLEVGGLDLQGIAVVRVGYHVTRWRRFVWWLQGIHRRFAR